MVESGLKCILVPLLSVFPVFSRSFLASPFSYCWNHTRPSLLISTDRLSERAFTTVTPTPWSPPETL